MISRSFAMLRSSSCLSFPSMEDIQDPTPKAPPMMANAAVIDADAPWGVEIGDDSPAAGAAPLLRLAPMPVRPCPDMQRVERKAGTQKERGRGNHDP